MSLQFAGLGRVVGGIITALKKKRVPVKIPRRRLPQPGEEILRRAQRVRRQQEAIQRVRRFEILRRRREDAIRRANERRASPPVDDAARGPLQDYVRDAMDVLRAAMESVIAGRELSDVPIPGVDYPIAFPLPAPSTVPTPLPPIITQPQPVPVPATRTTRTRRTQRTAQPRRRLVRFGAPAATALLGRLLQRQRGGTSPALPSPGLPLPFVDTPLPGPTTATPPALPLPTPAIPTIATLTGSSLGAVGSRGGDPCAAQRRQQRQRRKKRRDECQRFEYRTIRQKICKD